MPSGSGNERSTPEAPSITEDQLLALRRSARHWRILACVCIAIAVALGWLTLHLRRSQTPPVVPAPLVPAKVPEDLPLGTALRIGPWGELEVTPILIERPDHQFSQIEGYFVRRPWVFTGMTPEELHRHFSQPDLSAVEQQWLNDESHWHQADDGAIGLQPSPGLVIGLSPEARSRLYAQLAKSPQNVFIDTPFLINGQGSSWAEGGGLSPATIAEVEALCYERGEARCFSDIAIVGASLPPAGRLALIRTLSRVQALLVRLVVRRTDNLESVAGYWGAAAGSGRSGAILRAIQQLPQGGRLDISYLLPAFARERLYTFPDPATDDLAHRKDCFWTALNFSNRLPNRRFLEPDYRIDYLWNNYDRVDDAPRLGDVLVLVDRDGNGVHACVYIAADIVFTKNGASQFSPWVLMDYQEMLRTYTSLGNVRRECYRPRTQVIPPS